MNEPKIKERYKKVAQYYCGECIGNAEQACIKAGYSKAYSRSSAYKIMANVGVQQYICWLTLQTQDDTIAVISDIKAFWTDVMNNEEMSMKYRLRASELLAKALGVFNTESW